MSNRNREFRALVTEVLPHELPLIFTNDFHYLSLVERDVPENLSKALEALHNVAGSKKSLYTKPYDYLIRKERMSSTQLSIMHPRSQRDAAKFYHDFAETIIASCALSPASLRRPTAVTQINTSNNLKPATLKNEVELHIEVGQDEAELSHIVSFFVYREINLLAKFYDSEAYLGLEKRYSLLRTLDISKCFYSIYTHSITWAVKGKEFAKQNYKFYSFEQQFDTLMQRQNYNETNGILVGPELSRLFAEIIFQRIDSDIIEKAKALDLEYGIHFEFRRYVDDYFIYANDKLVLDKLQDVLSGLISFYKMHLNEAKEKEYNRPFVTDLSAAKREIRRTVFELKGVVKELIATEDVQLSGAISRLLKNKINEARLIIGEHGIGFHNVSGWSLSILRGMIEDLCKGSSRLSDTDEDRRSVIERALWALYNLIFYIASLDLRVTTTYSLAHILSTLKSKGFKKISASSDWIEHFILKEILALSENAHANFHSNLKRVDSVESFNILIIGAHFFGRSFTCNDNMIKVCKDLLDDKISYFSYIVLKFFYLTDPQKFASELLILNTKAIEKVEASKDDLKADTEAYLLLCDLLSAPDLTRADKRSLWKKILPRNLSNLELDHVGKRCGFVDWTGIRIENTIARHRLRPVYE